MFNYYTDVAIISKRRSTLYNDNVKIARKSAQNETCTPQLIIPNGISHTNHMNGHVVSTRHPVLGPGYKIVDPPKEVLPRRSKEVLPRRSKMAPTTDPRGAKKTTVTFNHRVCSIPNSHDHPIRRSSLPQVEKTKNESSPKLLRSQSTQTDTVFYSKKKVLLKRSPSAPPLIRTCPHIEEPVLRSRSSLGSVSCSASPRYSDTSWSDAASGSVFWSPRARCSDTSSSDAASENETDSSFSMPPDRNPAEDYQLSVILIGDSGTGKTCLVARLAENVFVENYDVTVGIDFNVARFNLQNGRPVRLQLWDTAGQEKFRAITSSYYRKAMGVVLVYDVTRPESLSNIMDVWRNEVEQFAEPDVVLMLVGNKMDLDDFRTVTTRVGAKVAAKLGAVFYEVSAKEDLNVRSAFRAFGKEIIDKVYSLRNPCLSSCAVHLDLSNHDNNDRKIKGGCSC